jgi:hypothetical protein
MPPVWWQPMHWRWNAPLIPGRASSWNGRPWQMRQAGVAVSAVAWWWQVTHAAVRRACGAGAARVCAVGEFHRLVGL